MSEYKKVENAKAEMTVTLEGDSWKNAIDSAFNKLARKVEVKGFRKGQAPKHLVEKYISHNETLLDAAESLAQKALEDGIAEHDVTLIDLLTHRDDIIKALVEHLLHLQLLDVVVQHQIAPHLTFVLIFILEVVSLLVQFPLEVLLTLRGVHQQLLQLLVHHLILLLLHLTDCIGVGHYHPEVKQTLALLTLQHLNLAVDDGIVLYAVRNE